MKSMKGRLYFFEEGDNATQARRKRRTKNWRKSSMRSQKKKRTEDPLEKTEQTASTLLEQWLRDLQSGGSNNSTSLAGIKFVIQQLSQERPFTKRSVFVDMGSGAGIPCVYVAKRFGCRAIGVEKDPDLVKLAVKNAEKAGVADLCRFICDGFENLGTEWLLEEKVTHFFAFDGVFRSETWNVLFHRIVERGPQGMIGASVSRFSHYWPSCLQKIGESTKSVHLAGSASSFRFGVWRIY